MFYTDNIFIFNHLFSLTGSDSEQSDDADEQSEIDLFKQSQSDNIGNQSESEDEQTDQSESEGEQTDQSESADEQTDQSESADEKADQPDSPELSSNLLVRILNMVLTWAPGFIAICFF